METPKISIDAEAKLSRLTRNESGDIELTIEINGEISLDEYETDIILKLNEIKILNFSVPFKNVSGALYTALKEGNTIVLKEIRKVIHPNHANKINYYFSVLVNGDAVVPEEITFLSVFNFNDRFEISKNFKVSVIKVNVGYVHKIKVFNIVITKILVVFGIGGTAFIEINLPKNKFLYNLIDKMPISKQVNVASNHSEPIQIQIRPKVIDEIIINAEIRVLINNIKIDTSPLPIRINVSSKESIDIYQIGNILFPEDLPSFKQNISKRFLNIPFISRKEFDVRILDRSQRIIITGMRGAGKSRAMYELALSIIRKHNNNCIILELYGIHSCSDVIIALKYIYSLVEEDSKKNLAVLILWDNISCSKEFLFSKLKSNNGMKENNMESLYLDYSIENLMRIMDLTKLEKGVTTYFIATSEFLVPNYKKYFEVIELERLPEDKLLELVNALEKIYSIKIDDNAKESLVTGSDGTPFFVISQIQMALEMDSVKKNKRITYRDVYDMPRNIEKLWEKHYNMLYTDKLNNLERYVAGILSFMSPANPYISEKLLNEITYMLFQVKSKEGNNYEINVTRETIQRAIEKIEKSHFAIVHVYPNLGRYISFHKIQIDALNRVYYEFVRLNIFQLLDAVKSIDAKKVNENNFRYFLHSLFFEHYFSIVVHNLYDEQKVRILREIADIISAIFPKDSISYINMAILYLMFNKYNELEDVIKHLKKLNAPTAYEHLLKFLLVIQYKPDVDEDLLDNLYKAIMQLQPENYYVPFIYGRILYYRFNKIVKAANAYKRAIQLNESFIDAYLSLLEIYSNEKFCSHFIDWSDRLLNRFYETLRYNIYTLVWYLSLVGRHIDKCGTILSERKMLLIANIIISTIERLKQIIDRKQMGAVTSYTPFELNLIMSILEKLNYFYESYIKIYKER